MSDPQHVVCPHCNATNRIPADRVGESPRCGQCHEALFSGHPVELTAQSFRQQLQHSDIPVLVDFWAPWCGPCRMMAPGFVEAAKSLEPKLRLGKVNTDAEQQLAGEFAIRSIPTLILFKGGREVARQSGAIGAGDIVRWAQQHA